MYKNFNTGSNMHLFLTILPPCEDDGWAVTRHSYPYADFTVDMNSLMDIHRHVWRCISAVRNSGVTCDVRSTECIAIYILQRYFTKSGL